MNILAVGAHPDDIEYGCGGYLARAREAGHAVWMLVATRGERGGPAEVRETEQANAAAILGVTQIGLTWPDTGVMADAQAVDTLERLIGMLGAEMVLVNTPDDGHQDHHAIARATLSAARRISRVLCYHAPSSTRVFTRVLCADITNTLALKLEALKAHASQSRHRLVELAQAEAVFWGGRSGVPYAEAFEPVRWLL